MLLQFRDDGVSVHAGNIIDLRAAANRRSRGKFDLMRLSGLLLHQLALPFQKVGIGPEIVVDIITYFRASSSGALSRMAFSMKPGAA